MSESLPAVRIGILGCADVANYALIVPVREVLGLTVNAIAGRDPGRALAYAKEHGVPRVYSSYGALIDADDIDVVYIALINRHHCDWTVRALQAGKAVLCEKPMASNEREADLMMAVAESSGKPLIEAFHYRHHPLLLRLCALLAERSWGRMRTAEARWLIPGSLVSAANTRMHYELSGGAAMDPGCYCVDLLRRIAEGEPAIIDACARLGESDIDVDMRAVLEFPNGCIARMHSSLVHAGKTFAEMDMWLEIDLEDAKLTVLNPFLPQMGHELRIESAGETVCEHLSLTSSYVYQARNVLQVIRGEAPALTPGSEGVRNMHVIDGVYRASGMRVRGE